MNFFIQSLFVFFIGFVITASCASEAEKKQSTDDYSSKDIVGTWITNVEELGQITKITWTAAEDGTTQYQFESALGIGSLAGSWEYKNGALHEEAQGQISASKLVWVNKDHFILTIEDNGVDSLSGAKRHYHRKLD